MRFGWIRPLLLAAAWWSGPERASSSRLLRSPGSSRFVHSSQSPSTAPRRPSSRKERDFERGSRRRSSREALAGRHKSPFSLDVTLRLRWRGRALEERGRESSTQASRVTVPLLEKATWSGPVRAFSSWLLPFSRVQRGGIVEKSDMHRREEAKGGKGVKRRRGREAKRGGRDGEEVHATEGEIRRMSRPALGERRAGSDANDGRALAEVGLRARRKTRSATRLVRAWKERTATHRDDDRDVIERLDEL